MENLQHHYVQVNGIGMHYVQTGSGPLVLLLHGFPEFWYSWRHQLAALEPHCTVVAPDLRGYNESDKPAWGYEIDVLASDVSELIRALGHERAMIVGHDWGGAVAWMLAILYPECVERLVVMNLPHPILMGRSLLTNPLQMLRSIYMAFFQLPLLPEALISANNFAALDYMLRGTAFRKEAFSDEDIERYKEALRQPGALTAMLNWYRAMGSNLVTMLRQSGRGMRVTAPTMLIWGEQDPALGVELTYGTQEFVPDLRICYIKESAHWVQQEQPELVNTYLLEFFADTSRSQP